METTILVLMGLIVILGCHLINILTKLNRLRKNLKDQEDAATKWQKAYYQLWDSDAVDKENFDITLPWIEYGDNAIRRKHGN